MKTLEQCQWKAFRVEDLFEVNTGANVAKSSMSDGQIPRITATDTNNGVDLFTCECDNRNFRTYENVISISFLGSCFYQPYKASFDMKIHSVKLKDRAFNKHVALFIACQCRRSCSQNTYGNQMSSSDLKQQLVFLPINIDGGPDYQFMEEYMKQLERKLLMRYKNYLNNKSLVFTETKSKIAKPQWGEFLIEDIGMIMSGQDIYDRERLEGKNPYVTATALQNGIGYFVGNSNKTLSEGCISVNRNGSVGYAFYHPYKALFGNDTRRIVPNRKKRWANFFITRSIAQQKDKYGYGLKLGTDRLKKQIIMLPVNKDGKPNYEYMERYMRNIEHRLLNRYIDKRLKSI